MKSLLAFLLFLQPLLADTFITYQGGEGIGAGKHIVFLASDHEYRAEETCPALARILSKQHGFKCTVIFGVDKEGHIKGGSSDVKGLSALQDADLFFIFARFLNLPEQEMDEIIAYLDKGGPVVGLRTSSHAFKIPQDSPYAKYSFDYKGEDYVGGFGQQILGNTWEGHYGKNHKQLTRIEIIPEKKDHPILQGVGEVAYCYAGGYMGIEREDFDILTNTQPLKKLDPTSDVDPQKGPVPSTWTHRYQAKDGSYHRTFHSTQGASEDILDDNYRRLIINGTLWAAGMEEVITPDLTIDFVGDYTPNVFIHGGHATNVKPEYYADYGSPISPKGEDHAPGRDKLPRKPATK